MRERGLGRNRLRPAPRQGMAVDTGLVPIAASDALSRQPGAEARSPQSPGSRCGGPGRRQLSVADRRLSRPRSLDQVGIECTLCRSDRSFPTRGFGSRGSQRRQGLLIGVATAFQDGVDQFVVETQSCCAASRSDASHPRLETSTGWLDQCVWQAKSRLGCRRVRRRTRRRRGRGRRAAPVPVAVSRLAARC